MNVKFVENWVFFEIVISFKIVFFIEIFAMWWLFLIRNCVVYQWLHIYVTLAISSVKC